MDKPFSKIRYLEIVEKVNTLTCTARVRNDNGTDFHLVFGFGPSFSSVLSIDAFLKIENTILYNEYIKL